MLPRVAAENDFPPFLSLFARDAPVLRVGLGSTKVQTRGAGHSWPFLTLSGEAPLGFGSENQSIVLVGTDT